MIRIILLASLTVFTRALDGLELIDAFTIVLSTSNYPGSPSPLAQMFPKVTGSAKRLRTERTVPTKVLLLLSKLAFDFFALTEALGGKEQKEIRKFA